MYDYVHVNKILCICVCMSMWLCGFMSCRCFAKMLIHFCFGKFSAPSACPLFRKVILKFSGMSEMMVSRYVKSAMIDMSKSMVSRYAKTWSRLGAETKLSGSVRIKVDRITIEQKIHRIEMVTR
jgi:hypothetical protein